jgi:hypothetical protein
MAQYTVPGGGVYGAGCATTMRLMDDLHGEGQLTARRIL